MEAYRIGVWSGVRASGRVVAWLIVLAAAASACVLLRAPSAPVPLESWRTVAPEEVGWSAVGLGDAMLYSRQHGTRAAMVVVRGAVVASWGDVEARHDVGEMRRSLVNALVGLRVARREVDLSSTLEQLGIDDRPPGLTALEKRATVADLLTNRSGVYHGADLESAALKALRPARGSHPPGTWFVDNSWDVNALQTIVAQRAGRPIGEELLEQIARPVGMEDFRGTEDTWVVRSGLSDHAGYTFAMSTRDLARLGLLYLRNGAWGRQQILPADWVTQSTTMHVPAASGISQSAGEGGYGYGYLWWGVSRGGRFLPCVDVPAGTFAAFGGGGDYLIVVPAYDLVVVHRMAPGTDPKARRMTPVQFGQLLRRLFDAAGVVPGTPAPATAPCGRRE
jgi:CubicO group peptidase (beta-lactamase class C family)